MGCLVTILWPQVKAKLVADLPAVLPDARVYDGDVVTGEKPARYLTVGWQPSTDEPSAGGFEQSPGPDGFAAAEIGSVLLEVAAVTGDTTRMDVFEMADAISAWVQAHQTLDGVLSANGTVAVAADVLQEQRRSGAAQRLLLSLNYTSWL